MNIRFQLTSSTFQAKLRKIINVFGVKWMRMKCRKKCMLINRLANNHKQPPSVAE